MEQRTIVETAQRARNIQFNWAHEREPTTFILVDAMRCDACMYIFVFTVHITRHHKINAF